MRELKYGDYRIPVYGRNEMWTGERQTGDITWALYLRLYANRELEEGGCALYSAADGSGVRYIMTRDEVLVLDRFGDDDIATIFDWVLEGGRV